MSNTEQNPSLENGVHARYVHCADQPIARDLFAAGIPLKTIAHTMQVPPLTLANWLEGVAAPATPLIPICKLFTSCENPDRYAVSKKAANERVHEKPIPRWWSAEFGYDRESKSDSMDALWALEEFPTQGSWFLASHFSCACAVCGKSLYAQRSIDAAMDAAISEPVGTLVKGYTTAASGNLFDREKTDVTWGVGEVVCTTCWPAYEIRVEDLLAKRRERLAGYVQSEMTRSERAQTSGQPSELQQLCERYGVSHVNLWVPLHDKGTPEGEKTYYKVDTLSGEKVSIWKMRRLGKRKYSCGKDLFEQLLIAKATLNSATQPVFRSELQMFCEEHSIAPSALVIQVKGEQAKASFIRDGVIWFASKSLAKGKYWTSTPEQILGLIKSGGIKAVPLIQCTKVGGEMRFPCAQDPDLNTIGRMLAEAMPRGQRPAVQGFLERGDMLSPASVWRRLASIGDQIGKKGLGRSGEKERRSPDTASVGR